MKTGLPEEKGGAAKALSKKCICPLVKLERGTFQYRKCSALCVCGGVGVGVLGLQPGRQEEGCGKWADPWA